MRWLESSPTLANLRSLVTKMASLNLLQRLRSYWPYASAEPLPPLSTQTAVSISFFFTIFYVLPLYLSAASRPSRSVSRDDPNIIRARIRSVCISCSLCTLATFYILKTHAHLPFREVFRLLGWYPISLPALYRSILLTAMLFLGPLFERFVIEKNTRTYLSGQPFLREVASWIGWRNYIAGPISEELIFRSLLIPINLLSPQTLSQTAKGSHAGKVVLTTPLFFGLAHLHHLYEFRLLHPQVSWTISIAQTVLRFAYTTLFGWFAAFLFVRTGSLWAVILVHSFCNWMGLPRLWGKVERPVERIPSRYTLQPPIEGVTSAGEGQRPRSGSYVRTRQYPERVWRSTLIGSNNAWTVAYYTLLLAGVSLFWRNLWTLSDSKHQLAGI